MYKRSRRIGITEALVLLAAIGAFVLVTSPLTAGVWNGAHNGGGRAVSTGLPDPEEGFNAPPGSAEAAIADGTVISFGVQGRADELVVRPRGGLMAAPGAIIIGKATWVDHGVIPPRIIRLITPTTSDSPGYVCGPDPQFKANALIGIGTDSAFPGETVRISFRTFDRSSVGKADRVHIFLWHEGFVPGQGTPVYYAGFAEVTGGQVIQHACQQ